MKIKDFEFEHYEQYAGDVEEVKNKVENCPSCGSRFFFSHSTDAGQLITKETASCVSCDYGQRKTIYCLH